MNKKEYHAQYYLRNKEKMNKQSLDYYYENREKLIKERVISARKRQYGMTPEMIDKLLTEQHSKCAICGTDKPGGRGHWHIDHDHQKNKVRGMLCQKCNRGLGLFNDDPILLIKARSYLRGNE